jgi:enoyl-CoA hydratase/carnithine racemase
MKNPLIIESKNQTIYMTLNNPEKMNCMDLEVLELISEELLKIENNANVKVLVIKGAGNKAFSTGGNLKKFKALTFDQVPAWIRLGHQVFNQVENLGIPTMAQIQGYAMGGGLELALACDFRIATENSIFSFPELQHGWIPGWGGLYRLKKIIGEAAAKEMIFLGEKFTAEESLRLGIIHRMTRENQIDSMINLFIEKLQNVDLKIFRFSKSAIQDGGISVDKIDYDILATQISKHYEQ